MEAVLQIFRQPGHQRKGDIEKGEVAEGIAHQGAAGEEAPPGQRRIGVRLLTLTVADQRALRRVRRRVLFRGVAEGARKQQHRQQREEAQQNKHHTPVMGQQQQADCNWRGQQRSYLRGEQADAQREATLVIRRPVGDGFVHQRVSRAFREAE